MNPKDTRSLRLYVLAGLLTLVLLVFAGILYNTQIVNHDYYVAQSIRTIAREEKVEASRGVITDRSGQVKLMCLGHVLLEEHSPHGIGNHAVILTECDRALEEKIKELQEFISRFSANKSKSKQATARRKLLDKLTVEEMPASSRRYPFVGFTMERECGKEILAVEGISKTLDGRKVLDNVSFRVNKGDKIAFVGEDEIAKTTLFKIVMGEMEPDEGTYKWGTTITTSYFPLDNSAFFNDCDLNLVDWLAQFTPKIPEANTESFKRAFLGRMLFSGDDVFKPVKVLSGGEKVRCMLSRMMLYGSNVLVLDQPTNHLDLESITAVNNGLMDFKGVVLFSSHDHEFVQTIANRIMVLEDGKLTDRLGTYEDYIASMANTAE